MNLPNIKISAKANNIAVAEHIILADPKLHKRLIEARKATHTKAGKPRNNQSKLF